MCVSCIFFLSFLSFTSASFKFSIFSDKLLLVFSNSLYSREFFISTARHWVLALDDERFTTKLSFGSIVQMRERLTLELKDENKIQWYKFKTYSHLFLGWVKLAVKFRLSVVGFTNAMELKQLKKRYLYIYMYIVGMLPFRHIRWIFCNGCHLRRYTMITKYKGNWISSFRKI